MKKRYRLLADGRSKPIAPAVVQFEIVSTGQVLDYRPDARTHPWPPAEILAHSRRIRRFIRPDLPSSEPWRLIVHDVERCDELFRSGYFTEPGAEPVDNRRVPGG